MKSLRDLIWILPSSLVLGLVLSLLGPGTWWIGWLAYFVILALGLLALSALWRSAGATRTLGWMLLIALALRLAVGIFFSYVLPAYGYVTQVQQAGYIYRDAFTYDNQAWDLAASGAPLWKAFARSNGIEEQYGGLTFVLSLTYRVFSPDAHRVWLTMLLSALVGTLGVGLAWKAARQAWGEAVALILGWIIALYPESLLVGCSQIREPYLILFMAMAFWGGMTWQKDRRRTAWIWLVGSLLGMFVFSPGVAVVALIVLGVWFLLANREIHIHWGWVVGAGVFIVLASFVLSQIVAGSLNFQLNGGPLETLVKWLRVVAKTGAYGSITASGWFQVVFKVLPKSLRIPVMTAYGIAQPVLPAAIVDPTVWPMRVISILRSLGWYALLPLLIYSLRPAWKTADRRVRMAWLWLWLTNWLWIILASVRAGGDEWDNPRYRVMLLIFQAALAAYSICWARQTHDRWLVRLLAVEGVFVVLFGGWYVARYLVQALAAQMFTVLKGVALASVLISGAILVGGWIVDRRRSRSGH